MGIHVERLFNSYLGKIFLSIILGLGISGLFHKVCDDGEDCLIIKGPNEKKLRIQYINITINVINMKNKY